jgi:ABC-type proline/glycine betaine transport system substrate-binding protein
MKKPGDRVGVLMGGEGDTVKVFGYGVYEGDFIPEEAAGFMAEAAREVKLTNPRLRLDNGKAVYGCESWWGSEEAVKAQVAKYKNVVMVDIDEERAKVKKEEEKKGCPDIGGENG